MEKIILAHAAENEDLALAVEQKLSRIGVPFERMSPRSGDGLGHFVARLQSTTAPIILFVTDNFLRSKACMSGALEAFQQLLRTGRALPVIADGKRENPETGEFEAVPTNFERVIHAITYMNFWQSVYLEARSKSAGSDQIDPETRQIRDISNEIGEFLNSLRNAESVSWRDFAAQDFQLFFKKFGITDFYDEYRKLASFDEPMDFSGSEKKSASVAAPAFLAEPSEAFAAPEPEPQPEPEADIESENEAEIEFEKPVAEAQKLAEPQQQALAAASQNGSSIAFFVKNEAEAPAVLNGKIEKKTVAESFSSSSSGGADWDLIADEIAQEAADIHARRLAAAENLDAAPFAFSNEKMQPDPVDLEGDFEIEDLDLPQNLSENEKKEAEKVENEPVSLASAKLVQPMAMPVFQHLTDGASDDEEADDETETAPTPAPFSAIPKVSEEVELTLRDARFWLEKGQIDEARGSLTELLAKNPACAECWAALGDLEEKAENFAAARSHFEKALVLEPALAGLNLRLARLLDQRFKGQKKAAAQHFRAALKEEPTCAEAAYRAGAIYFEHLGKLEKAAKYFEKTVEIDPHHALAWYDLAHLNRQLDRDREAAFFYQKAIEVDPSLRTDVEDRTFYFEEKIEAPATQLVDNQQVASAQTSNDKPQTANCLTVLVTGATSGIGRATAEIFAKNGHRVILTGRRMDRLEELTATFQSEFENEKIASLAFDVRDRDRAAEALAELPEGLREIDLLINNAGLAKGLDTIDEGDWAHWDEMIDTNLKGLLAMTRLVAPSMVARGRGHIINVGSIAGKEVYPKGNVYNATKFAVDALTRSMRLDLVPKGVKVSSVSPGHVEETEFALVRFDGDAEKARIYDDFQPLTAGDVAEAIYFMATRPAHVQIHDIVLTGAQQASATAVNRSGR